MRAEKNLGICMDHSSAHLIEFTHNPMESKTIDSKFTHQSKEESLHKNENLMHNKEQHQQSAYYKELGNVIRDYEEVLLFGPTDAKFELFNLLKSDHNFSEINIVVKPTDKMTEHQQNAFVRDYFSKQS